MTRDEKADRQWAALSLVTQLTHRHRQANRRLRVGLLLVRLGLAVAPIRPEDFSQAGGFPAVGI